MHTHTHTHTCSNPIPYSASQELTKAQEVEEELRGVLSKRLSLTLRINGSPFSSNDAFEMLDYLAANMTTTEAVRLRNSLNTEIANLQEVERDMTEKSKIHQYALDNLEKAEMERDEARRTAEVALEEERAAREAWERAQKKVAQSKEASINWGKECSSREFLERRAGNELQRVSGTLSKRQDRLRKLLYRKEQYIVSTTADDNSDTAGGNDSNNATEEEVREQLEKLRKKERALLQQQAEFESSAAEMKARAASLDLEADNEETTPDQLSMEQAQKETAATINAVLAEEQRIKNTTSVVP